MQSDPLLPLLDAIEQTTGYRPHPSTAMRWCLKANKHGNVLESWMIGGRRMTSVEAVQRYNEANTRRSSHCHGIQQAPVNLPAAHHSAMQALQQEGL
ncbi:DUF1580 domain-containing protein [Rhodopirellula baltica]|uniref:Protein containing DUF1580 n=1 Tax=Rhodopirellula baltica WH47 TaxID=991778 RepID=F2AU26_RHOBT|nr:DUF1580 domain-containing protein [Rhodopirellula baltica]EGF26817.1 protein containing DUF1580 [Rhodopirellula baltica WH47]